MYEEGCPWESVWDLELGIRPIYRFMLKGTDSLESSHVFEIIFRKARFIWKQLRVVENPDQSVELQGLCEHIERNKRPRGACVCRAFRLVLNNPFTLPDSCDKMVRASQLSFRRVHSNLDALKHLYLQNLLPFIAQVQQWRSCWSKPLLLFLSSCPTYFVLIRSSRKVSSTSFHQASTWYHRLWRCESPLGRAGGLSWIGPNYSHNWPRPLTSSQVTVK